ncbi:MAG: GNAT family N-acetyltransferase [Actinomycetota bacterium]
MTVQSIEVLGPDDDVAPVDAVFRTVWGDAEPVVPAELLIALAHSDNYVAVARNAAQQVIAASVGVRGVDQDGVPILHSHVTGVAAEARGSGVGVALKEHQRAWAAARRLSAITWTFDPLVRRNARFNIARLGAEVTGYHLNFYGEMTDAVNAGDVSDRLAVRWAVTAHATPTTDTTRPTTLVPTPDDVVALRRHDPATVAGWRAHHRAELAAALTDGARVVGFTVDGDYVLQSAR